MTRFAVIIPVRYDSTRFLGKPLVKLLGVPMVVRTYQQVIKAVSPSLVYVATDSQEIRSVCQSFGIQVLMTSSCCLTGTDRVLECVDVLPDVEMFVNVQGDEPIFNPLDLIKLLEATKTYQGEIVNGFCPIETESQFRNSNVPKVVFRPDGRLLYMSRSPIPCTKSQNFKWGFRQVCCYAFPVQALRQFNLYGKKSPLESVEDIEVLRFLELGFDVRMIQLSSNSISVDVPEDVVLVEKAIRNMGQQEVFLRQIKVR